MKEGAARTSGPLFLYNVTELEKVPLTGPLARFPKRVGVGGMYYRHIRARSSISRFPCRS